jgi:hypothetical protein
MDQYHRRNDSGRYGHEKKVKQDEPIIITLERSPPVEREETPAPQPRKRQSYSINRQETERLKELEKD